MSLASDESKAISQIGEKSPMKGLLPRRYSFGLACLAMVAFAGNSVAARLAFTSTSIDAASFTTARIVSGACVLWVLVKLNGGSVKESGTIGSAFSLFAYALAFSIAYETVPTGTGAILLFGAVQMTMIYYAFRKGERLVRIQICGLALAFAGLVGLTLPGISAPPLPGALLMMSAGVAWGLYSIAGMREQNPVQATAGNFIKAVPLTVVLTLFTYSEATVDYDGLSYAVFSGALASGLGYSAWYLVIPHMKRTTAATVQLTVPVIAALCGITLLSEPLTPRFVFASIAILGGIALVALKKA